MKISIIGNKISTVRQKNKSQILAWMALHKFFDSSIYVDLQVVIYKAVFRASSNI